MTSASTPSRCFAFANILPSGITLSSPIRTPSLFSASRMVMVEYEVGHSTFRFCWVELSPIVSQRTVFTRSKAVSCCLICRLSISVCRSHSPLSFAILRECRVEESVTNRVEATNKT
ncbi:hypothetical protein L873DRAFT_1815528 [Choiromyces venosus 120613-1]|uniref:Uncharacterized protein n=1 Tax=Choiromyces venosus 120613-1 TaxID=1336337 RepID=A0A3N4JAK0_9PEZI|nr:hypothetical protein L873DRAFT_1815528 [Choiromyces venosus 120613-1]